MNRRQLTRVEREWPAFPFQPLDDLFVLAGTDSADAAEAFQFLRNLMVGAVRSQWVRHSGDDSDGGRLPNPDWDQWSGPGSG